MAKIALRVYNNEIKDLTDHGQIEEAIAHCRHILETYPKHVDTYRLLGKAYLEEQRYGDAADILQRVLSSLPEDFISQVGMSIIREDEGNLATAIFHMERAFEVQPSNHAIQDELKRLYGRRDGIEPQKIRLTRGALARMYAHGNLHDLAVAELLAALSEDPQRFDLMVLLANMYYQAENQVEAAETCTKILEKLPYCLDANRLLAIILEVSSREENAKVYRGRWEELDPYAVALDIGEMNTEFVPNQTITVERLEWEPGTYDDDRFDRPAWAASLGINIQGDKSESGALPDWMSKKEEEVEPTEPILGEPTEDRKTPPLWESTFDQEQGELGSSDLILESDGFENPLSSSEIPPENNIFPSEENEEGTPEWLRTPYEESSEPLDKPLSGEGEEIPDWMQAPYVSTEPQKGESLFPEEGEEEGTPEWMSSLQDESYENPITHIDDSEEIPDFMKEAGWEPSSGDEDIPQPVLSDALSDEQDEQIAEGEIPAWMQDLAHPDVKPEPGSFIQEETHLAGEIQEEADQDIQASIEGEKPTESPTWLSGAESQEQIEGSDDIEKPIATTSQPAEESETLIDSLEPTDQDEGLGWLESLAAKHGVAEEELVTSPEERSETPPDWLQETTEEEEPEPEGEEEPSMEWLDQLGQEEEDEAAPTSQVELQPEIKETPPVDEILGESSAPYAEEDEGLGWLESLAAKQGVAEEEQVTNPEERGETPPDWLQETTEEGEPQPEDREEPSMEWLDQLNQEAKEEVPPPPTFEEKPIEEAENWLDRLGQPDEPPVVPISEYLETESEEDKGIASLEDVSPEQGTEEEFESQSETGDDLSMEWLDQLSQEASEDAGHLEESFDEADSEVETWLGSLEHPTEDSKTSISEPIAGEADEGLAWLENLAGSGASDEEVPESSVQENIQEEFVSDLRDEELPEWVIPEKERPTEELPEDELSFEWLTEMSQEGPTEGEGEKEVKVSTDWLIEMSDIEDDLETEEELGSTPEAIDKVDEWIQSLDQPDPGDEKPLESEIAHPPIEHDAETIVSFTSVEETDVEPVAETIPSYVAEDETTHIEEPESETPMIPEWLQDVADQKPDPDAIQESPEWLPEVEEPIMEREEATPTRPSEWQPESEVKAQPIEEESKTTPTSKPSQQEPIDMLKEARQAMHEHKLDEAINTYTKLIKRGKEIEDTIEDIQEALRKHPIYPALWQVLGDALMRSDRLQEALDAYSKAENLLR